MTIIDFKEITQANLMKGEQDEFELFSRDFFEFLGYCIISEPTRGQDNGLDILVEEIRSGVGGETRIRWLVSCKHHAHSGKAVGTDDEVNVDDRVKSNHCDGFIGFYSTIPSSGLMRKLKGLAENENSKLECQILDHGKIEKYLLEKGEGITLAKRYFPISMSKWKVDNSEKDEKESREDMLNRIRNEYYEEYIKRKNSYGN